MRILAIDPGPRLSGFILVDDRAPSRFLDRGKVPNEEMLDFIERWNKREAPDVVALELVQCYGMAVGREVFETVYQSGQFGLAAKNMGSRVVRVSRPTVKSFVTGMSKAKDKHVRQALMLKYGGTKKGEPLHGISGDVWAALAVADYVAAALKNNDLKEW